MNTVFDVVVLVLLAVAVVVVWITYQYLKEMDKQRIEIENEKRDLELMVSSLQFEIKEVADNSFEDRVRSIQEAQDKDGIILGKEEVIEHLTEQVGLATLVVSVLGLVNTILTVKVIVDFIKRRKGL